MATRLDRPDFAPINPGFIQSAADPAVDIDLITIPANNRCYRAMYQTTDTKLIKPKTRLVKRKHVRSGEWSEAEA